MAYNIDFDKIYDCINTKYGTFKIIEDLGNDKSRHRKVKIRFLNTGNEKEVRMEHVLTGNVRDDMMGIDFNKDYESARCGKFNIIRMLPSEGESRMVEIRFINTGYTRKARLDHALSGNVIDKSIPQVYGVGYYGNVKEEHKLIRHWYKVWNSMLSRCYNKKDSNYNSYGGKGVKVCDRWFAFENFLEDIKYIPGYPEAKNNPESYHLDKDYLQIHLPHSQRIYSKDTCMFLTVRDNVSLATNSKYYELTEKYTINPIRIIPEPKLMVKVVNNK